MGGIGASPTLCESVSEAVWFISCPPACRSCLVCSQSRRSASFTCSQTLVCVSVHQVGFSMITLRCGGCLRPHAHRQQKSSSEPSGVGLLQLSDESSEFGLSPA